MILVSKHATAPLRLAQGDSATATHCAVVVANSQSYVNGLESFDFSKEIYGHASVKKQLKKEQHGKCCYCEGKFEGTSSGDVEHFRPKMWVLQDRGQPKEYPGYYWLVYSWPNLYFSCEICNRSFKKNFFPLKDSTKRAKIHTDNINDEQPLLLDPGGPDDPRDHIHFHGEVAKGITEKGRKTVSTLKLDRTALNEERLVVANYIRRMKDIVIMFEENPSPECAVILDDVRIYLARAVEPDAIYSAMAQDLLRQL